MIPTGSRLLIGATVVAIVAAVLYGITQEGSLGTIWLISAALALAARARSPRRIFAATLAPAELMLLLGLSGKLAVSALFPDIIPSSGYEADWQSVVVRSFWAQADLFAFGMAIGTTRLNTTPTTVPISVLATRTSAATPGTETARMSIALMGASSR